MLELNNISLKLGDFYLHPISYHIEKKSYTVLLGPCGSGKTKLLEIISGLRAPESGSINWSGENITNLPPEERNFGLMYQNPFLFPHLSVKENILFGKRYKKNSSKNNRHTLEELIELLKLEKLIDRKDVNHLSGGEKQKIALARCLILNPSLLLLDEPSASLDIQAREELYWLLRNLNRNHELTIIHVTHYLNEAVQLAGNCLILLDGKLSAKGNLNKILKNPQNHEVAHFLGFRNIFSPENSEFLIPLFNENQIPFPQNKNFCLLEDKIQIVPSSNTCLKFEETIRLETGLLIKLSFNNKNIFVKASKLPSSVKFLDKPEKFTLSINSNCVKLLEGENI